MFKHSPEPWRNESITILGADGKKIAIMASPFDLKRQEANVRRIVACVNACAGISTDALNSGAIENLIKSCEDVLRQAEEYAGTGSLLDALRDALSKLKE
ncbi:MAG: hypothetical protein GXP46_01350 [Deferribacteres bacterium]|nr:hypothetical protein [Deferribacteres bacterium]